MQWIVCPVWHSGRSFRASQTYIFDEPLRLVVKYSLVDVQLAWACLDLFTSTYACQAPIKDPRCPSHGKIIKTVDSIIAFTIVLDDMGGCQNCGPFLGTLNIRCRMIIRTQKGTLFLTTTHMCFWQILPCKVGFHAGVVASGLFVLGSRAERNLLVN